MITDIILHVTKKDIFKWNKAEKLSIALCV